jgi:replicative DNA helicase
MTTVDGVKDLELDVLSSCVGSSRLTRRVSEALDGYRFSDRPSQWIWRAITDGYKLHGRAPRIKVLAFKAQNDIKNEDLFDEVIARLRVVAGHEAPGDLDAVLPEIVKAYNQQRILETVDSLIDAAETGDIKKAQELLTTGANAVNRRSDRTGSSGLVEIARQALAAPIISNAVPTGLAWVDRRIRGIAPGQVFLMSGITGIGKSVSMIQAGQAGMGAGKRVIHFTTEMDKESVTYRYLSRFTGIPEQRIRERRMSVDERKLLGAWLDRNEDRMNDLLRIEQVMPNSGTIADIQAGIDELDRDARRPDLVIIDSPDHLRSIRHYNNWLHESTEVWWGVKAIADRGYSVWCTTQINRGKWEFRLATPEAVADNYNKARIADAFFSVNWVLDKHGKSTGKRRLFWGKYRSGASRIVIPLRCDLARMIMITEPEPEDVEMTRVD